MEVNSPATLNITSQTTICHFQVVVIWNYSCRCNQYSFTIGIMYQLMVNLFLQEDPTVSLIVYKRVMTSDLESKLYSLMKFYRKRIYIWCINLWFNILWYNSEYILELIITFIYKVDWVFDVLIYNSISFGTTVNIDVLQLFI